MFDAATEWQRAFVLHQRPYQDNKVIVTLFNEQNGKVSLIARKKQSKTSSKYFAILQPFVPFLVTYRLKNNASLGTFLKCESGSNSFCFENERLFSALYLNELLMRLLLPGEKMLQLYATYEKSLHELASEELFDIALRKFEKELLIALGYGIDLKKTADSLDIMNGDSYDYRFGTGFTRNLVGNGEFGGEILLNLAADNYGDLETRRSAKKLFSAILKRLLGDQPLKSRELFKTSL